MLGYLLSPTVQFEDINGKPLVGGKVYVYKANTSTLATTYSDYNGTMNTNPVILDLLGHCTVIADDGEYYDIEVYNNDNILLFSAHLVTVGGEGGSASVSGFDVKAGYGIKVGKSISGNKEVFTVSADPTYLATKTDLNDKQNTLIPGNNISISGDTISVTGLKTINVTSPLQKTETASAINLSIDTSGIQTTLSAGTNIDEVKLSNNIVDLKADNCSASINSIAIGQETLASGDFSFAEGQNTSAFGDYSHAEGTRTSALRYGDHAEGSNTVASGEYSHAEGYGSNSIGYQSHAEGYNTSAFGSQSHSEGDRTQSIGYQSHAEGYKTSAIGPASHAEGEQTSAVGSYSHAEGDRSRAIGQYSHAEGTLTSAVRYASHAEGYYTIASGDYQTVIGKYNAPNTTDLFQIGCGSADNDRKNAVEVKNDNTIVVGPSSIKLAAPSAPTGNYSHFSADAGGNTFLYAKYQQSHKNGDSIKNSIIMGPAQNFMAQSASSKFDDCIFMGQAYMYSPNASGTYNYEGNIIIGYNSISNAENSSENNTIIGQDNDFLGADWAGASAHKFSTNTVIGYQNNSFTDMHNTTIIGSDNDVGNTLYGISNNKEVYAITIVGDNNEYEYDPNDSSPYYGLMLGNNNTITNKGNYKTVTIGIDNALTGNCTYLIGDSLSANNEGSYDDKIMKIGFGTCHLEIHSSGTIYKVVNGTKTAL